MPVLSVRRAGADRASDAASRRVPAPLRGGGGVRAAACLVIAIAWVGGAYAAMPGPVINATLTNPAGGYELRGAGLSADGVTQVLMAEVNAAGAALPGPLVRALVDPAGRITGRTALAAAAVDPAALTSNDPAAGTNFALLSDGRAMVTAPTTQGDLRLLQLPAANTPAVASTITVGRYAPLVREIVPTAEGRMAIAGSVGERPLFAWLAADGRTIARRATLPDETMTIVAAASAPDGGAVVAGEKGIFPDSTAWIGRVAPSGAVLNSVEFPGRPLDIARAADGAIGLVIERKSAAGSDVVLQLLGPELAAGANRTLVSNQRAVPGFRIVAAPGGGFVVAGVKDRGRWITRVNAAGQEVWLDFQDPRSTRNLEIVSSMELLSRGDTMVAAYTAFVVDGREQKRVVRVVRFPAG